MMRKIPFFAPLLLILGLLSLSACNDKDKTTATSDAAAKTQQTYQWKMVTTWPPNFPVFQEGVDRFAKMVETMSQGRLKIQVFAGGELVPAMESFDAVSQGSVQMGHGAAYYWAGKVPAAQFMSAVPFGMNGKGMDAWFYGGEGKGLSLWRELYKPFDLRPFPMGNSGVQMGGWFNKKITQVEDLKGLKMRIPGLGGKVLAKAGGSPVLLAGSELYTALERGVLDATEWVGPFHDQRLGLDRAAKYYYTPGWHEPGTTLELIVNQQAWDSLPADLQAIIDTASIASNQWMSSQFEVLNLQALRELEAKPHVEILTFPPAVLAKLKAMTAEVLTEEAAKNPEFKRIYEAYSAFQKDNDAWSLISEVAYYHAGHPDESGNIANNVQKTLQTNPE
ncbi:TRAP transporter substrate-binding protein [Candidatus Venteria ishoeyi]|uniref:Monocarboxylate 2-oxoacid-binding periplasmic protein n=1 Tax=Candidatus Venteria ishoeyi TaxID=1899563 RepID=A0A1H6F6D6_9GAMM|nr:TRAP transporter substrate-binding protein [Candidatus Venteria ishoeyi]SEH04545.1 Monocarboxylate 2-oxoacid-binding periplasmic protein precursor [Candidatus Venteria ishoeyi]